MKKFLSVLFFLAIAANAHAVIYFDPLTQTGGNGHYYEAFAARGITWTEAYNNAISMGGYLATFTSAEENDFVWSNVIAGSNPYKYLFGGYQLPESNEPGGGWAWVTGEAWDYADWAVNEPNNSPDNENVTEYYSQYAATWNDISGDGSGFASYRKGYIVEFDTNPVPEPMTMMLMGIGLVGFAGSRKLFVKK